MRFLSRSTFPKPFPGSSRRETFGKMPHFPFPETLLSLREGGSGKKGNGIFFDYDLPEIAGVGEKEPKPTNSRFLTRS